MSPSADSGKTSGAGSAAMPAAGLRLWHFGTVDFDESSLSLKVDGQPVALEHRPMELLRLLLNHAGEVVTKDEILEAVWPGRVVTEASLTKCVARLRQALNDSAQLLIRTVHGYGYRLAAEVSLRQSGMAVDRSGDDLGFRVGDVIPGRGNWCFVERLQGGGFGEVWLGEQTRSRERRVFKFARSSLQLTALKREITLSRVLYDSLGPRPDLPRIVDWNLDEPPCFIELEWSPEGSLGHWADSAGGIGAVPMAIRLDLIAQIADALAAAHSVGVLHKDLKPANVLIWRDGDAVARIRLTDFGSGRVLDTARLDQLGITRLGFTSSELPDDSTSGTPLYLAPELQAGQPPTVKADIYSLGVMLYQCIVGDLRRPLAPGWEAEIADELLREDVLLSAAGDAQRRLADAAELATRLRSLEARRAERLAMQAREQAATAERQRLADALLRAQARRSLLRALAASFLIGFAASTWLYLRADAASRREAEAAATARSVTEFLTRDLLSAANPLLAADPALRVHDLLGPAAADLDRHFAPGTLARAVVEQAIGQAYVGLSDYDKARPLLESALETRRRLLGPAHRETLDAQMSLIELLDQIDDVVAVKTLSQQVLDLGAAAGTLDAETELSARQSLIAVDCMSLKLPSACLAPEQAFLEQVRQRLGPRHELAISAANDVAFDLASAQRFEEAIPLAREVLTLTTEVFGEQHLLTASRQRRLGTVLNMAEQYPEAIPVLQTARGRMLAITGRENEYSVAAANDLAYAYLQTGRPAEALPLFQAGLDYQRGKGVETPKLTRSMNHVATTLASLGRPAEAARLQTETLAIDARIVGENHPDTLNHAMKLAQFRLAAGDREAALALARDTLTRARKVYVHGEWDLGYLVYRAGSLNASAGRRVEARPLLQESVQLLGTALGHDNRYTQTAARELAAL